MDQKEKLIAVLNLLKSSVDSNLNASLKPEECQLLLDVMAGAQRAARSAIRIVAKMPPPAPRASSSSAVEKIVEGMADIAHGVIEDLAGDFTPRRKQARPRRRKP